MKSCFSPLAIALVPLGLLHCLGASLHPGRLQRAEADCISAVDVRSVGTIGFPNFERRLTIRLRVGSIYLSV